MKTLLSLMICLLCSVLFAADEPAKKEEAKEAASSEAEKKDGDQQKIQGKWKVESCQRDGKASQARVGDTDTYKEDKLTMESMSLATPVEAKFKLDSGKKPAEIDVVIQLDKASLGWRGIYKLEGDSLTICWSQDGGERPTDFNSQEGDGRVVFVCKRIAEEKK